MKTSSRLGVALGVVALGLAALVNACGGAENMDVLGEVGSSTSSGTTASGGTSSGTGTTSSGGTSGNTSSSGSTSSNGGPTDGCVRCGLPVPANCTQPDPCSCNFVCPDGGGSTPCQWSADGRGNCPEGSYCDAPNCSTGVCAKLGSAEPVEFSPQCGCNGITYWNGAFAKKAGMAIRSGGACSVANGKACGGVSAGLCPNGTSCNTQVSKKSECNALAQGLCWQLPATCPAVTGHARPCGVGTVACMDECTAIRKQSSWYEDGTCP